MIVRPVWLAVRRLGAVRTHIKKIRYNVALHLFSRWQCPRPSADGRPRRLCLAPTVRRDDGAMTRIIAHRGASRAEQENTLEAFRRAGEMGADGIELDVRRTADDRLVEHR